MKLKFSKEEDAFWAEHEKFDQGELLKMARIFKEKAVWIHRRIGSQNIQAARELEDLFKEAAR
jgi:hypothetical protein